MYSISTNFYPDNKDAMVGYIEAVTGVGLILGPLFGSFLYALGGYVFIFYSFGGLFMVSSFFIKMIFGSNIDQVSSNEFDDFHLSDERANNDEYQKMESSPQPKDPATNLTDDDNFFGVEDSK